MEETKKKPLENHFKELPFELLLEIFAYFKRQQDLLLLSLVCKQWFHAIESDDGILECDNVNDVKDPFRKFWKLKAKRNFNRNENPKIEDIVRSLKPTHIDLEGFNQRQVLEILEIGKDTLTSISLRISREWGANTSNVAQFMHVKSLE